MSLSDIGDWAGERWDAVSNALDKRIDNEIVDEPTPAPGGMYAGQQAGEVTVKTSDDQFGKSKKAGTGVMSAVSSIPAPVWVGLGLAVLGVVAWKVLD